MNASECGTETFSPVRIPVMMTGTTERQCRIIRRSHSAWPDCYNFQRCCR
ncbi:hypothetical protein HMPREF1600_05346 [Escherichia coli 907715]|nr:hypothetical protein HMPREF1600_05346 [Escherichia coli 907715]